MFFHSIDFLLGKECPRLCYKYNCYHPKVMFEASKKKKSHYSGKCQYFSQFKRMLVVKDLVFKYHRKMLRLYEKSCDETEQEAYWGHDADNDGPTIDAAEATNEVVSDDTF